MMSMNLKDYVKIYDVFDVKFCKKVIKTLKNRDWEKHTYHMVVNNKVEYGSYEDDLSVVGSLDLNNQMEPEIKTVNSQIWHTINQYITVDIKNSWFGYWSGYTHVRFNRYDKNTKMRVHCDHIHDIFDGQRKGVPTLSVLGSLNNDYEGGELIFWESDEIELKAGQVMVFPSNFLYPHEVKSVTKGVRYSFVSWVW